MTKKQIVILGVVVGVLMILFPPIGMKIANGGFLAQGYTFIANKGVYSIDATTLFFQLLGVGIVAGAAFWFSKE